MPCHPRFVQPAPFLYDNNYPRNLPGLDEEEFGDLTAVLRALARGTYPRLDAVPLALNAYNCNKGDAGKNNEEPWAYFHPVSIITPEGIGMKANPEVDLDYNVLEDLQKPWQSIQSKDNQREWKRTGQPQQWVPREGSARYRFICFIHKHRIERKSTLQKGVHTISIWDREWNELTWHDTYHVDRDVRRREIKRFWEKADVPGLIGPTRSRKEFLDQIRYRTVYHICERIEDTTRIPVPPRNTLWSVIGVALYHMNHAREPQVSIVPDRLELFGAHDRDLLPRFFAHLLWLCLDARPAWSRSRQERFVRQFRVQERLRWMKLHARAELEVRGGTDAGSDGSSTDDGYGGDGGREWMYGILNI
ncbi:hypothetical protein F4804DRAFT_347349 [Jackrogersella minutella]|nr:hypothetical protein F4804DRAFT_347349 [Jackrogersella minutella]